jgi:4'-phosphopantetheinyl transferase
MSGVRDVPAGDDWLGPREATRQASLRLEKRRRDWRLGRFIAKRLLRLWRHNVPFSRLEIVPADDGAPEPYEGDRRLPISLSITHRSEVGACAVAPPDCQLGCDLELIEPRSMSFLEDYFTAGERSRLAAVSTSMQGALGTLLWSAKEAALKSLRTGLRRDTRSLEVRLIDGIPMFDSGSSIGEHGSGIGSGVGLLGTGKAGLNGVRGTPVAGKEGISISFEPAVWRAMVVHDHEQHSKLHGWWRLKDGMVLTIVASRPIAEPVEVTDQSIASLLFG